jgi:hypothetical protein
VTYDKTKQQHQQQIVISMDANNIKFTKTRNIMLHVTEDITVFL